MKKNELSTLIKEIIIKENDYKMHVGPVIDALDRIKDDKDLYKICQAIAPDSVASGWSRTVLLDAISDVLLSRL